MRCLDLFSGIGGFSRGLRYLANTVAFCDMAPESCAVLSYNEDLKTVPVLPDVTEIDESMLDTLTPNMITGGFPCQDISSMRMKKEGQVTTGLDGPRSSLFFEIPRLIAASKGRIQHVLLENSPCLVNKGSKDSDRVIEELQKMGLHHIAYGVFAASDVGAIHRRRRWFLLASSAPSELPLMTESELRSAISHPWTRGDIPRVIPRPNGAAERKALLTRNSLMGNSVVPQAVAFAYQSLTTTLQSAPLTPAELSEAVPRDARAGMPLSKNIVVVLANSRAASAGQTRAEKMKGRGKEKGNVKEVRRTFPRPELSVRPEINVPIRLTMKDNFGDSPQRRVNQWMTPRHHTSTWNQGRTLNERAMWDLANGIFYEVDTLDQCPSARGDVNRMSDVCSINPRFVENLMGYPMDWTRIGDYDGNIHPACGRQVELTKIQRQKERRRQRQNSARARTRTQTQTQTHTRTQT